MALRAEASRDQDGVWFGRAWLRLPSPVFFVPPHCSHSVPSPSPAGCTEDGSMRPQLGYCVAVATVMATSACPVATSSERKYLRRQCFTRANHNLAAVAPRNPGFLAVSLPGSPGYALYPSAPHNPAATIDAARACSRRLPVGLQGRRQRGVLARVPVQRAGHALLRRQRPLRQGPRSPSRPPASAPRPARTRAAQ